MVSIVEKNGSHYVYESYRNEEGKPRKRYLGKIVYDEDGNKFYQKVVWTQKQTGQELSMSQSKVSKLLKVADMRKAFPDEIKGLTDWQIYDIYLYAKMLEKEGLEDILEEDTD